ncbi:MAG: DivIVA domain-containing protein [Acidimicrobiia bacterium]
MALTPDEIRSREFHLADRGYDRAEVQAFLARLADEVGDGAALPWAEAEERLLLVLDAARRAVETVREEASRALRAVGDRAAEVAVAPEPTPPAGADLDDLRHRLAAALEDVESALGAIDPGDQRTEPSTRPSS